MLQIFYFFWFATFDASTPLPSRKKSLTIQTLDANTWRWSEALQMALKLAIVEKYRWAARTIYGQAANMYD